MEQQQSQASPPWLVFWKNGGRVGSTHKTEDAVAQMHQLYHAQLIQRDASGSEHWALLGIRTKRGIS
jgi:hypothetical protein